MLTNGRAGRGTILFLNLNCMIMEELKDKCICLIIWNAEKDDDVRLYLGNYVNEGKEHYFVNKEKGWRLSLNDEQLERMQLVPEELKETLLNADYSISMTMGSLPDDETDEFISTGMNWTD